MGKVLGVILLIAVFGFLAFQIYGFVQDIRKRKALKKKNQEKISDIETTVDSKNDCSSDNTDNKI